MSFDYSKLPREELIREIEVWRNRCADQQLVFVDDLQPKIDAEFDNLRSIYNKQASEFLNKAAEYDKAIYGESIKYITAGEKNLKNHGINTFRQYGPRPSSIKEHILRFFDKNN